MARKKNRFNALRESKEDMEPVSPAVWRAGIYARLSVELSTRKSESIETQLQIMHKYLDGKLEFSEVYEYVDRGYTGTDFHRPAFEQMMNDVRRGRINCVMVKDMSRLGRDYLDTCNYVEIIFPFLEVRFISVNDHFDTEKEHCGNKELEITLKNLVNDMYARDVSKRVSTVRMQEQQSGKFMGSNAPYGYRVNPEHPLRQLEIDEAAAAVVRDIYSMVLGGMTLREIAVELQRRNLSIPGQYLRTGHLYNEPEDEVKKWYIGSISNILHSQAYIGNLVQGRRRGRHYKGEERHFTEPEEWLVIEGTHEPIIDRKTFDLVQKILEKKVEESVFTSERTADIPVKANRYHDLIYCGICGQKLSWHSSVPQKGSLERRYYFLCSDNYDIRVARHKGIHITEQVLEEILKDMIGEILNRYEKTGGGLMQLLQKQSQEGTAGWQREIRKVGSGIADLDAISSENYGAYVLGTMSREEFRRSCTCLEEKRALLEHKLGELNKKCEIYEARIQAKQKWLMGLSRASEGELDEDLLQLLISRIELHPMHELRITWRFSEKDLMHEEGGISEWTES